MQAPCHGVVNIAFESETVLGSFLVFFLLNPFECLRSWVTLKRSMQDRRFSLISLNIGKAGRW
jgi:hypothetical protein